MSTHARFSPSSAYRWLTCTKSTELKTTTKQKSSIYATRGSAIHDYCDDWLNGNQLRMDYRGYVITDDDIQNTAKPYVDYVESLFGEIRLYEKHVTIYTECSGTADAMIFDDVDGTLHVVDLKCGNTLVKVKNNTQLMSYALGAVKEFIALGKSVKKVITHIVQPSIDNIVSWEYSLKDISDFQRKLQTTIDKTLKGETEFHVSSANCHWCPHKYTCPAIEEKVQVVAKNNFENLLLSERLDLIPALKVFISATETRAMETLLAGDNVPNYKLSPGRKMRYWKDKKLVEKELGEKVDLFKKDMLTVAQVEKILKKEKIVFDDFDSLVVKESKTIKVEHVDQGEK